MTMPLTPDRLSPFVRRLREAVAKIDEKSDTHTRAILSGFYRFIGRSQAHTGGIDFPISLRRHPLHPARTREHGTRTAILIFSVANAIMTLYEASTAELMDGGTGVLVNKAFIDLEARVKLIELIARYGIGEFLVDGNDAEGYHLVPSTTVNDLDAKQILDEKAAAEKAAKDARIARRQAQFPKAVSLEAADKAEDAADVFDPEKTEPDPKPILDEPVILDGPANEEIDPELLKDEPDEGN